MNSDVNNYNHVLGLDIVRFGAAWSVLEFHYRTHFPEFAWTGWIGVEVFFVVSGYVISFSATQATAGRFFRSRFLRLMPAIWICATATAAVLARSAPINDVALRYLKSLILWPAGPWVDGVYWTLPVEVGFYALVWLTLFKRPWLSLRGLIYAVGWISTAYWGYRVGAQLWPRVNVAAINEIPAWLAALTPLEYGSYFALGALMHVVACDGATWKRLLMGILFYMAGAAHTLFIANLWAPPGASKLLPAAIWSMWLLLILASIIGNKAAWRLFGRYARVIRSIGLSTYPLYLLHSGFGSLISAQPGVPFFFFVAIIIIIAFGVAEVIEPRARALVRKVLWPSSRESARYLL